MATHTNKHPLNVPGRFYVDDTCIDCGLCRQIAPTVFRHDEESGFSYVFRQPVTDDERTLALEAAESCPTESIGGDGELVSARAGIA